MTEQNVETVTKLERAARKQRTPTDPPGREDCEFHSIAEKVGADLSQDPQLQALSEETQPERLIEQIEARENS